MNNNTTNENNGLDTDEAYELTPLEESLVDVDQILFFAKAFAIEVDKHATTSEKIALMQLYVNTHRDFIQLDALLPVAKVGCDIGHCC